MKGLKPLLVVIFFTLLLYWGIEPYAHSKLNPHVDPANYDFAVEDITLAKTNVKKAEENVKKAEKSGLEDMIKNANLELENAEASLEKYSSFWDEINKIDLKKGDAATGAETFLMAGCTACHGVESAGMPAPMGAIDSSQAYGANPPDLSIAGKIFDDKFLAALIKDPVMAQKLDHKFGDEVPYPMPGFYGVGGDINQELADIVAYLKSIVPNDDGIVELYANKMVAKEELSENDKAKFIDGLSKNDKENIIDKVIYADACQRCHDMKYDDVYADGDKSSIASYLGSTPPDLSMYIRSRSKEFLHNFLNDTQKMLPGTAMPRVGLNQESETKVIEYMENIGDSKKAERESLSIYIMIYFVILAVFAGLWKRKVWSNLH